MPTFVYDKTLDCMVDKDTRAPMNQPDAPMATPMVMRDTPGYASPIDGKWIDGRRARKYDLQKNNCVDAGDMAPKKLKNAKFAAKHGMTHLLDT